MNYTITPGGIIYTVEPEPDEISTAEAVAVCERISAEHAAIEAQLEAALNPANVSPSDEQRERIKARIMEQCECAQIGVKPCGMCEG